MECTDLASLQDPTGIIVPLKLVGSGGFGRVYRGRYARTGQLAAIKIMRVEGGGDNDLERELYMLRNFSQHKNISNFYGAFLKKSPIQAKEDEIWLVQEFCGGGSIWELVHNKYGYRLSEDWIAYLCRGLLRSLAHLHANHVIHGDVKGLNIMLTDDAEVKLVDLGLSTELDPEMEITNNVCGTPIYMAPEVIACADDPDAVYDYRCDVWSCGITAIEMAERSLPHEDQSEHAQFDKILRGPAPTLSSCGWSQIFIRFVECCLVKDYTQRPSAEELLNHPFIRNQPNERTVRNQIKKYIFDSKITSLEKLDEKLPGGQSNLRSKGNERSEPLSPERPQQELHIRKEEEREDQPMAQSEKSFERQVQETEPTCKEEAHQQAEREVRQEDGKRGNPKPELEEEQKRQRQLQEQMLRDQSMLLAGKRHRKQLLVAPRRPPLLPSSPLSPSTPPPPPPTAAPPSQARHWLKRMKSWFTRPSWLSRKWMCRTARPQHVQAPCHEPSHAH